MLEERLLSPGGLFLRPTPNPSTFGFNNVTYHNN